MNEEIKSHEKPDKLPLFIFLMLLLLVAIGMPVITIILALLLGLLLNPNDVDWVMTIIIPLLVIAVFIWWMTWAKEFRC